MENKVLEDQFFKAKFNYDVQQYRINDLPEYIRASRIIKS